LLRNKPSAHKNVAELCLIIFVLDDNDANAICSTAAKFQVISATEPVPQNVLHTIYLSELEIIAFWSNLDQDVLERIQILFCI
jgi:hypothetical protein